MERTAPTWRPIPFFVIEDIPSFFLV